MRRDIYHGFEFLRGEKKAISESTDFGFEGEGNSSKWEVFRFVKNLLGGSS